MTLSSKDLDDAVGRGVISAEQAAALRAAAGDGAERRGPVETHQERFRFLDNFADIFICIGQLILIGSAATVSRLQTIDPIAVYAAFAVLNWLMLEYFGRINRRYAPAVVAAVLFAYCATVVFLHWNGSIEQLPQAFGEPAVSGLFAAALLAAFLRTRLPILLLPIALFATIALTLYGRIHLPGTPVLMLTALAGLVCLALAIRLDMKDPTRSSRTNDHAFWLFVIGSPMTIHSLFITILMNGAFDTAIWIVLACALCAVLLGIVLDRRSLVVSSLIYIIVATTYGSTKAGAWDLSLIALVPMAIGLIVIVLGVKWQLVRATLMRPLSPNPLFDRLPPIT